MTRDLSLPDDATLLPAVVRVARAAGERLLAAFAPDARPQDRTQMFAAARRNEEAASDGLREALETLRPGARWLPEEFETGALPAGEWWVVDAVEGNVNHVHGMSEWGISIALVHDGEPVLAVVHQPVGDLTTSALRGGGVHANGQRLQVSAKSALDAAIVVTGQAEAGQRETHARIGASIAAMLDHALLVRTTVPSTFPMLLVAAGRNDVFWQYAPVLPGVAAGVLFAVEAGGIASRIDGSPWRPGSPDILVAAPALHAAAVRVLAGL